MTSQPKLNIKYGKKSTRKNILHGGQECRSWIQLITTVYSVRDDKSCGHDRTDHTGAHTHQREALQNHSPKYKGRCSWCSYSMRHIQRPVVCCLVSWENIVNLEKKSEGVWQLRLQRACVAGSRCKSAFQLVNAISVK